MSDLTFALLIVGTCAAPILLPLLGLAGHRVYARVASPRPRRPIAYDERDLLHTDPREWVRQAERTVEAEQGQRRAGQPPANQGHQQKAAQLRLQPVKQA